MIEVVNLATNAQFSGAHTLTCVLPRGVGTQVNVVARVITGGRNADVFESVAKPLLSYKAPVITGVSHPSCFALNESAEMEGSIEMEDSAEMNGLGLIDCPRTGGGTHLVYDIRFIHFL